MSKDPIGISGGVNLYVAFANNAILFVDPWGENAGVMVIGGGMSAGAGSLASNPAGWIVAAGLAGFADGVWIDDMFGVSDVLGDAIAGSIEMFRNAGERGHTAKAEGTANGWKHRNPHPTDPTKTLEKDPHTG